MSIKYVQTNTLYLAGSGVTIGATSASLTTFTDIYANVLTMTSFGDKGYITFEPDTTNEEAATFTGVTANANGTYTLTGLKTALAQSPYTETSGLVRQHAGGTKIVVTDNVSFWDTFINKHNTSTIDAIYTFATASTPLITDQPTTNLMAANKLYVDTVTTAGAPDASAVTKGITRLSVAPVSPTAPIAVGDNDTRVPTQGENDALVGNNTDIAVGTGNKFVTQTGLQHNAEKYAADAGANDTYVITLSPVPTSYTNGMIVYFKANTANTGAATINVNSLGAKTIVKYVSTTLADGDIAAGMFCTLIYDGTNFVLQNPIANIVATIYKTGNTTHDMTSTTTTTIAHGLGVVPKITRITMNYANGNNVGQAAVRSFGTYDGTTQQCEYTGFDGNGVNYDSGVDSGKMIRFAYIASGTGSPSSQMNEGTVSVDATNISITWSKTGSPTGTGNLMWEVVA